MVSASDVRWGGGCGSRLGWSLHCFVVSLDMKRCSTLSSVLTQVYKWVPATHCNGLASHPGGVPIRLVASC